MEIISGGNHSFVDCCSIAASAKPRQLRRRRVEPNDHNYIDNAPKSHSPKYLIKKRIDAETFIVDVDWISESE